MYLQWGWYCPGYPGAPGGYAGSPGFCGGTVNGGAAVTGGEKIRPVKYKVGDHLKTFFLRTALSKL